MPQSPIGAHFDVTPDVERNFLAEIAFHRAFIFEYLADVVNFFFRQVADLFVKVDASAIEQALRTCAPDAIDISKSDFRPLFRWQVNARDTCHSLFSFTLTLGLTLTLLVLGIGANNPDHAFAVDQLALVANLFN
jgi:hypothetical protein